MNKGSVIAIIGLLAMAVNLVSGPVRADQVIADDLIVQGSTCVGFDCVNNESFGFDTIRLKENNLRIKFEDTSATAGFPTTDWQIIINDSASGGRSYFGVDNVTSGNPVLRIYEGAGGAVVIGEGSTASGPNTMSVGSAGNERRVTNVADGIDPTDAVNVRQLTDAVGDTGQVAALQNNFNSEAATRQSADNFLQAEVLNLQNRMGKIERRLDHVGALASAFSALVPNARSSANTQISLGAGYYGSSAAMAAGLFHYVNKNVLLNVGVSTAFNRHATAGRAGVTFGW